MSEPQSNVSIRFVKISTQKVSFFNETFLEEAVMERNKFLFNFWKKKCKFKENMNFSFTQTKEQ